jgi:plastocyanin
MPSSIIILAGDKVRWINTDIEAHIATSRFENFPDQGNQFDAGLLNANQTFEHTLINLVCMVTFAQSIQ